MYFLHSGNQAKVRKKRRERKKERMKDVSQKKYTAKDLKKEKL